ncbi:hypothetical protein niasHT_015105 [Heterodera trifolii]|uniref:G-protein coupled receptors family 1 profile domain-containing protein n=1 Tax=Heterodera trifolii TaxID=157864 RepID=A0ABD2L9J6_9BILA
MSIYWILTFVCCVAIALRLAWRRAHNRNWHAASGSTAQQNSASSSDRDSVRITVLCFAAQIPLCFPYIDVALNTFVWLSDFLNCDDHPIGQQLYYPYMLFTSLYYVSDEVFLIALSKDMRVQFMRTIHKIVFFCKGNAPATTTTVLHTVAGSTQYSSRMRNVNVRANGRTGRRFDGQ